MTRTLLLTTNYPPVVGGVSRYCAGLVTASQGRIEVAGPNLASGDSPGTGVNTRLRQALWSLGISRSQSKETSYIAGHPHLALGAVLSRQPFALVIHGGEWEDLPLGKRALHTLMRCAAVIIANSEATSEEFIPRRFHPKTITIHPAITPLSANRLYANLAEPSSAEPVRILCVTRLVKRKRVDRLIDAVLLARAAGCPLELDIVGDGPERHSCQSQVERQSGIRMHGLVDDLTLTHFYSTAHIFALLPDRGVGGEGWEGFGIVYLEAASWGLPVIATRSGGVEEAVHDEGSMLLAEACTAEQVAEALTFLAQDSQRRAHMGQVNAQWAQSQTWEHRSAQLGSALKLLINTEGHDAIRG